MFSDNSFPPVDSGTPQSLPGATMVVQLNGFDRLQPHIEVAVSYLDLQAG